MNYFEGLIGQERVKKKLSFFLEGYQASSYCPNMLFVASKGIGKTTLVRKFAQNLNKLNCQKQFIEINSATVRGFDQIFNSFLMRLSTDNAHATVFFDESSELPLDVQMAFLSIIDPDKPITEFNYDGFDYRFDSTKLTFFFATTESHKMFHALKDRLKIVTLGGYSNEDLKLLFKKSLGKEIDHDTLEDVSVHLRGNLRELLSLARDAASHLKAKKRDLLTKEDWGYLKDALSLRRYGLNDLELQVLRVLGERGPCRLLEVSSVTGLTRSVIQNEVELYLSKIGLIKVTSQGRELTRKGRECLNQAI